MKRTAGAVMASVIARLSAGIALDRQQGRIRTGNRARPTAVQQELIDRAAKKRLRRRQKGLKDQKQGSGA